MPRGRPGGRARLEAGLPTPAVAINPSGVSSVAEPGMEARQGEGGQGRPREALTKGTRPCARGEGRSAGRDARRRAGAVGRSGDATCSVALSFRRQGRGGRERRRRLRGTGEGGPAAASRSSSCTGSGGILGGVVPSYISMHKHPAERYINGWMGPTHVQMYVSAQGGKQSWPLKENRIHAIKRTLSRSSAVSGLPSIYR